MVAAQVVGRQPVKPGVREAGQAFRHTHAPNGATLTPLRLREPVPVISEVREESGIVVRELCASDVMGAAQLLARRHQRARKVSPELPAAYQSARPWFIKLGRRFGRTKGFVATAGDALVGFVLGADDGPGEIGDEPAAPFFAVAPEADEVRVSALLFAALSDPCKGQTVALLGAPGKA